MPKTILNAKAVKLRKQGLSYSEILKQVPVAKSTLSLWLRAVGLSKQQYQRLTDKKLAAMKRGWERVHEKRMERWKKIRSAAEKEVHTLTKNERWLLGIALYWAEGAKEAEYRSSTPIKFSNSDPAMLLIFKNWLKEFSELPMKNIRYELYIHERADWKSARTFWASKLKIKPDTIRVYFKFVNDADLNAHVSSASGYDIRFTDSDGSTILPHERISYTKAGGYVNATFFVKIPGISSSANKIIYIYYGNVQGADASSALDTWGSDYQRIYHFKNPSSLDLTEAISGMYNRNH